MTNETINLIIERFDHIKQLAVYRKTQTGAVMDKQECLNEIAAIANESKQFIEKYRFEQEPIDEEELEELVMKKYPCNCHPDERYCECCIYPDLKEAFKVGYRKAKEL